MSILWVHLSPHISNTSFLTLLSVATEKLETIRKKLTKVATTACINLPPSVPYVSFFPVTVDIYCLSCLEPTEMSPFIANSLKSCLCSLLFLFSILFWTHSSPFFIPITHETVLIQTSSDLWLHFTWFFSSISYDCLIFSTKQFLNKHICLVFLPTSLAFSVSFAVSSCLWPLNIRMSQAGLGAPLMVVMTQIYISSQSLSPELNSAAYLTFLLHCLITQTIPNLNLRTCTSPACWDCYHSFIYFSASKILFCHLISSLDLRVECLLHRFTVILVSRF